MSRIDRLRALEAKCAAGGGAKAAKSVRVVPVWYLEPFAAAETKSKISANPWGPW
jgi:hypothetical protein